MDAQTKRYSIGELARLTGLTVKTVRFYADEGLVPEAGRTAAGYRVFDRDAVERLGFVRTLRGLGIDLATIRRVLAREVTVGAVAAAHAEAIEVQIRMLRLRRAVLRAVAQRGPNAREVQLMDKLVQVSNEERRRMVADFLDSVFRGLDVDPHFEARMRNATPELPEDPSAEQMEAWIELAGLLADEDFRRRIRAMAQRAAADRAAAAGRPQGSAGMEAVQMVNAKAGQALTRGIDPASQAAAELAGEIARAFAAGHGKEDGPAYRAWLAGDLDIFLDLRAERYWQLLAIINGWPPVPSTVPAWEWTVAALRASTGGVAP